jgi:hypothetical protein
MILHPPISLIAQAAWPIAQNGPWRRPSTVYQQLARRQEVLTVRHTPP